MVGSADNRHASLGLVEAAILIWHEELHQHHYQLIAIVWLSRKRKGTDQCRGLE